MLKDQINEDFKNAFKEKKETQLSVLKMLKASLFNKQKEKEYQLNKQGKDIALATLDDEDIIDSISAEVKKMRDALALFIQGGREDLSGKAQEEINILLRYLPEQLGEDQVKKLVAEAVAQTGAASVKDMGKVMAQLIPKVKGRADAGLVSKLVKEALS
jgi:uncharacterized protein YqeY